MKTLSQRALGSALLLLSLAQGACDSRTEPEETEEVSTSTAGVSGTYDLAHYVIPDCASSRAYTTNATGIRNFIPMGVDAAGRGKYVYVTSSDGSNFLEFTIDANHIRFWTDTSWAHDNHPPEPACGSPPTPYCDEVCGTSGVPTSTCRCLWSHGAGAADFVFNAPRDAANTALGARFLPRRITVTGETESAPMTIGSSVTKAQRKRDCVGCDSWHSSPPGTSQSSQLAFTHFASYNGHADVIRVRAVSGPGAGEIFYYARGKGWVGFEKGAYTDWIGSTTAANPRPNLSCKGYTQASICSVITSGPEMSTQRLDVRYPMGSGIWITQCLPNLSGRYVWQTTASGKDAWSRWANFMWPEQVTSSCGTMNNGLYPLVFTSLPAGGYRGTWVTQCLNSGRAQHVYRIDTDVNAHPAAVYLYDEPNSACP